MSRWFPTAVLLTVLIPGFSSNAQSQVRRWESLAGTYQHSTGYTIAELILRPDSTFRYRDFFDNGGWCDPVEGRWHLKTDTVLLSTYHYPRLLSVREDHSIPGQSNTVDILDSLGRKFDDPSGFLYIRVIDAKEESPNWGFLIDNPIPLPEDSTDWRAQGKDSAYGRTAEAPPDTTHSPVRRLELKIARVHLVYFVQDSGCNTFTVQLSLMPKDFSQEVFLHDEPLLLDADKLYMFFEGTFNRECPLVRVSKATQ